MRRLAGLVIAVALGAGPVKAEGPSPMPPVELAPGSAPGWRPSEADNKDALKIVNGYLEGLDQGKVEQAYALHSDDFHRVVTLKQFTEQTGRFVSAAGALRQRTILKMIWAKDPPDGAAPGYYVAVLVASSYATIHLICHKFSLYETPDGSGLQLRTEEMRSRINDAGQPDPAAASEADREAAWAKQAKSCLN